MLKDIFPIKIYEVDYPNYEEIQQELMEDVMSFFDTEGKEHRGHRLFSGDSLTLTGSKPSSIKKLHKLLKNQDLVQFINKHMKLYWDGMGYDPNMNPRIFNMWANATGKDDKLLHHNHNPFEIAGAFYVNATKEMGNLALINPNEMVLSKCPFYSDQESLQEKFFWDHLVEPKPGKLVLFPGWMYHKTQPNTCDERRVVLAMSGGGIVNILEDIQEMRPDLNLLKERR